jgi:hypothetical protein
MTSVGPLFLLPRLYPTDVCHLLHHLAILRYEFDKKRGGNVLNRWKRKRMDEEKT